MLARARRAGRAHRRRHAAARRRARGRQALEDLRERRRRDVRPGRPTAATTSSGCASRTRRSSRCRPRSGAGPRCFGSRSRPRTRRGCRSGCCAPSATSTRRPTSRALLADPLDAARDRRAAARRDERRSHGSRVASGRWSLSSNPVQFAAFRSCDATTAPRIGRHVLTDVLETARARPPAFPADRRPPARRGLRLRGARPLHRLARRRARPRCSRPPDDSGLGGALEAQMVREVLEARPHVAADRFLSVNLSPRAALTRRGAGGVRRAPTGSTRSSSRSPSRPTSTSTCSRAALAELRARGALIAVDDAGAGYGSLARITALHPHFVKVDRSLVHNLDNEPAKAAVVETLSELASRIDAWVVAEGIERLEELDTLIRMRVPLGQGYAFGRPGPGHGRARGRARRPHPRPLPAGRARARRSPRSSRRCRRCPSRSRSRALGVLFDRRPGPEYIALVDGQGRPSGLVRREDHVRHDGAGALAHARHARDAARRGRPPRDGAARRPGASTRSCAATRPAATPASSGSSASSTRSPASSAPVSARPSGCRVAPATGRRRSRTTRDRSVRVLRDRRRRVAAADVARSQARRR